MAREYTPEELGIAPVKAKREFTPEELGLAPKKEYSPQELGLGPKGEIPDELGRFKAGPSDEVKTSNPLKGLAARAADLASQGIEGIARATTALGERMEGALTPEEKTAMEESRKQSPEFVQSMLKKEEDFQQGLFNFSKSLRNWSKDIGYAPSTQLGELPGKPLLVVPFIAERIIASSPDMVAAVGVTPAYIISRTNEILNDRLQNDNNKPWEEATVTDVAAAAGAAVLETYLEKFATKHLLPGGGFAGSTVGKRIGKETALQSGTEAVEEGVGYLGGAAGTEKGIDPSQMAQQMIEGAIVGGGLGAGVQGGKEYVSRPRINDGTSEPGISGDSLEGEAPGRIRRLDEEGLAVLSKRLGALDGREAELNNKLIELQNQQAKIASFDPSDPRAGEIEDVIKELKTELKTVKEEKATVSSELQSAGKEKAFNAPGVSEKPDLSYYNVATPEELAALERKKSMGTLLQGIKQETPTLANSPEVSGENWPKDGDILTPNAELRASDAEKGIERKFRVDATRVKYGMPVIYGNWVDAKTLKPLAAFPMDRKDIIEGKRVPSMDSGYVGTFEETKTLPKKIKTMNAPGQMGLDLTAPDENTKRTINTTPSEFGLTAPEGSTGVTTKAEPIQAVKYPTSKMMLVNTGVSPVKGLVSFFSSLKPAAVSESEVNAHTAEINKVIEEVNDFQKEAKGLDRTKRLTFLRDFIDKYSTAPEAKQNQMARLPSALAGMDVEGQQALLSDVSQFPKLNTVRGMKEFRGQLQEAMLDYTEAKLGRSRDSAILPWQTHEDVSTQKDASELQRLGNIAEKYMTPEEKAAKNYLTAHAEPDAPFASAMRSAAFDLGAEEGPVYPGQTKETAQLFRNWLAKNMHPTTLARFDATVNEFRKMGEKISKRTAEEKASEGKGIISGKATGKGKGAGFGRIMHPSVETRIANNDLKGALRALSKIGNNWQKELSKKLLSLDLATTIGYDKQQAFAKRLVDQNVGDVRNELFAKLETEFPSVFKQHFANISDIQAVYRSLTELKNGKLGVPKETVDANIGQIEIVREAYEASVAVLSASGTYLPNADSLSLNRDRGGNNPNTFLHEILHAATHWALDPMNYESLSAEQKQAVNELERTYKIAKELWGTGNEISSIDEFVVESFTNLVFQDFLKGIPMPNQKKTLWNKFSDFIKDMFGMNNVLGYTLANANAILQAPPNLSAEAKALNQQGKLGGYILDDTFKAGPSARTFINDIFSGKLDWSEVKENMPSFLENAKDSTRKHLLGALTLRQLQDIVGPRIPAFKYFINNMEGMLDERNAMLNKTRDIVKPWMEFQSKFKEKAETLNKLMLDATRLGIDPDTNTKDARLNQAWNEIGENGQKIYRQVRNFYKDQLDAHIQVLLDRKVAALEAKGLSKAEAKASKEYKDLNAHFRENTIEPYFPIRRFGQYWLQVGKGKSKEFYMFESAGERNKFQKQREKQLAVRGESKEISSGNSIKNLINENIQDFEFLSKLKSLIATETGNTRQELKDNILDSVEQMYLQTLPDQNIRKMFMNREGIQGMNQDMLRAFTASAFRIAYQQSRLAHSDKLYKAIDGAEKRLEGMPANEKKMYGDYIGELEKRLQYIMNPPDTGKIPSFLSNMSFIWYMTSPASALVNMLGVPAVGIPVVGAKFGNVNAAKTMADYARKFATTGFIKDGKPVFPSFSNKPDMFNARQQAAFDKFIADGLIDITLTHDIVGLAETPSNLYTGRTQKVMQVLSGLFHGAEKFNREVVAMSAYDLSYAKNIKDGLSEDSAQKKAIEEAKDLTYKSMFDYSALNKPRYFQGKYAKVILQFKQFSQQMTYMLARSAYEGFAKKFDANDRKDIGGEINNTRIEDGQESLDGKDLQDAIDKYIKDFKAEGKKRLMGTLGTTFIFAGATGLPGWAALSALMEMLHYIFADEDEEDNPFDFDNWFKNWAAETFGGFVGDSISRGVASQATGIDLADRMSLNDMWFRDQRKQPDMQSAAQAYIVSLMGPAVGLGVNAFNAYDQYSQGHIGRAIETLSPAIIKNGLKAARLEREGALTLSGDELIPDFSNVEIAAQAVGFQPERLAQKQKANIEMKNAEQEIIKKHDMLLNAAFLAIDTQDDALFERTMDKISRFNASNPTMAITGKSISNSVKRRYKLRSLSAVTGGAKINKKLMGQLGEMGEYGNID